MVDASEEAEDEPAEPRESKSEKKLTPKKSTSPSSSSAPKGKQSAPKGAMDSDQFGLLITYIGQIANSLKSLAAYAEKLTAKNGREAVQGALARMKVKAKLEVPALVVRPQILLVLRRDDSRLAYLF